MQPSCDERNTRGDIYKEKPATTRRNGLYNIIRFMALAYLIKLLDDREYEEGCNETDTHKCSPNHIMLMTP